MTDAHYDARAERRSLRLVEDNEQPRQADLVYRASIAHGHGMRRFTSRREAHAYAIGVLRDACREYDDDTRHYLDAEVRGLVAALDMTWPAPAPKEVAE